MFEQMEIFDFIAMSEREDTRTSLERFFGKIENPVVQCANCLCEHCVNNVEELWNKVRPEEQKNPCFNCDECWHYTGQSIHRSRRIEDCGEFEISDYAAASRRKKFKVVK